MKPVDSGSFQVNTKANRQGTTPATTNIDCQPNAGINHEAKKPPMAAPKEKPQITTVIKKEVMRLGEYSVAKVTHCGITPPINKPAMKRNTTKCDTESAIAPAKVNKPKPHTQISKIFLRPNLSAIGPATIAPMVKPNKAALITGAKSELLMPHCSFNEGAIKPITATSKPSTMTTNRHSAMIHF